MCEISLVNYIYYIWPLLRWCQLQLRWTCVFSLPSSHTFVWWLPQVTLIDREPQSLEYAAEQWRSVCPDVLASEMDVKRRKKLWGHGIGERGHQIRSYRMWSSTFFGFLGDDVVLHHQCADLVSCEPNPQGLRLCCDQHFGCCAQPEVLWTSEHCFLPLGQSHALWAPQEPKDDGWVLWLHSKGAFWT